MKTTLNPFENAKRTAQGAGGGGVSPAIIEEMQEEITDIKTQLTELAGDYSLTEHKTGRKWINGKDIYEITFEFNTTEGQQKTDSGVTLPTRETVISLSGMLGNVVPVYSNVDDSVGVIIENDKLVYYVPNWATTSKMYITMLYTKPTT